MLWTIAVLLLILWLLGMVSSYTLGGFIHILRRHHRCPDPRDSGQKSGGLTRKLVGSETQG